MVKIEKIVIQGFKSFKRKVSIPLPEGFSVITGPNGSGKSNIGDAISFVLGRSNSRSLRAKKTQELIFHGSKKKSGADFASVAMYFDNSKKILPFEEKSVTVSRRINKKGVSTYRINGKVVTRQQVVDIFSIAGIQPDGYNIIQQGDVNQVVEIDAVQRRQIIDGIAGITEYDEKKAKAEKELAKIGEKVREAELILNEKQSIMEKIKKERDAALMYKDLEANLDKIRKSVIWKDFSSSEKSLVETDKKIEEDTRISERLEKDITECDSQILKEEGKLEELTKSVVDASKHIDVTRRIAKLQGEMDSKRDRIESYKREIERIGVLLEKLSSIGSRRSSPALQEILKMAGVYGKLSDLVIVPPEYRTAVEVGAGAHLNDVVVDTVSTATNCINFLKRNKLGRARFLPVAKIHAGNRQPLPHGAIGWLSDLIHHEPKYTPVINYAFGSTACVKDINVAKAIMGTSRVRMVTLDGDLIESSGAMTGGYYNKKGDDNSADTRKYIEEKGRFQKLIENLEEELGPMNKELEILAEKERKTQTLGFEKERIRIDESLKRVREKRKDAYEKRLVLQQDIGKHNIQKARIEARFDNLKLQLKGEEGDKKNLEQGLKPFIDYSVTALKEKEKETIMKIQELGPINMKALDDFDSLLGEFEEFRDKVMKIMREKESIESTIAEVEARKLEVFSKTLNNISRNFSEIYRDLTNGDAVLELEKQGDINSGLMLKASPHGKNLLNIDSMSGGEKTLTAFAFLFAIQRQKPTPFYILDEADATLDKVNTKRISGLIKKYSRGSQFLVISHNDSLVKEADQIYGVSMEDGESKVIGVELPKEEDIVKEKQKNN